MLKVWNKKRKNRMVFLALFVLVFSLIFSFCPTQVEGEDVLKPLQTFAHFFEQEKMNISSWEIMMKEVIQSDQAPEEIIQKVFPKANIEIKKTKQSIKYFSEDVHKETGLTVKVSIVQDLQQATSLHLFFAVSGHNWSKEQNQNILKKISYAKNEFFRENATIFTCMKANSSAIMNSKTVVDKFADFTNIKLLDELNEPNFTVISGFIPELNLNTIPISHKENMNVQLAVRNIVKQGTTITIGTPILTIEY
jgi:hypothetical protein